MSIVHTTCTRDCPDACAVIAHVENGRVVRLEGDADHPLTRGFLCKKTYQYPSRVYSSNRILHPLERTKGGWRRITWNDAFDTLAEWLTTLKAQDGSLAVLHYQSAGSMGLLKALNSRFFNLWRCHRGGGEFVCGCGNRRPAQRLWRCAEPCPSRSFEQPHDSDLGA